MLCSHVEHLKLTSNPTITSYTKKAPTQPSASKGRLLLLLSSLHIKVWNKKNPQNHKQHTNATTQNKKPTKVIKKYSYHVGYLELQVMLSTGRLLQPFTKRKYYMYFRNTSNWPRTQRKSMKGRGNRELKPYSKCQSVCWAKLRGKPVVLKVPVKSYSVI